MKRNQSNHHDKNTTVEHLMRHEKALLNKPPKKRYVYYQEVVRTVRNNSLVSFDGNFYSAPEQYKGERVIVRFSDHIVRIASQDGHVLAKYRRCYGKRKKKYCVWNILTNLQRKAAGFDNCREKQSMPSWMKRLYENSFSKNVHEFLMCMELIRHYSKGIVQRMVIYHKSNSKKLTVESAIEFLSRC